MAFKPDFTQSNPYAGMPAAYAKKVAQGYIPTAANPLSPVQEAAAAGQVGPEYATDYYNTPTNIPENVDLLEPSAQELISNIGKQQLPTTTKRIYTDAEARQNILNYYISLGMSPEEAAKEVTPFAISAEKTRLQTIEDGNNLAAMEYARDAANLEIKKALAQWQIKQADELNRQRQANLITENEYQEKVLGLQQKQQEIDNAITQRRVILDEQIAGTQAGQSAAQLGLQKEQLGLEQSQFDWQKQQDQLALEQRAKEFDFSKQQFEAEQAQLARQWGMTQEQWKAEQAQNQRSLEQQLWERGMTEQGMSQNAAEAAAQLELDRLKYSLSERDYLSAQDQLAKEWGLTQEQWAFQQQQAKSDLEQQLWQRGITERQLAQDLQQSQQSYDLERQQLEQQGQYQQSQLDLQRQTLEWQKEIARQEAEQEQRNYLAGLAARPISWLEYSAAAQQTPAVQPWMLPLMPQEYSELQAGAPMPGWQPNPQGNVSSMQGMPELTTPSAQYAARMGPTAQQQFLGYQQAQTGAMPAETEWRLWSQAPPSGQSMQLNYGR